MVNNMSKGKKKRKSKKLRLLFLVTLILVITFFIYDFFFSDGNFSNEVGKTFDTAIENITKSTEVYKKCMSDEILKEECAVGNFVLALSEFEKEIIYRIRSMTISELSNVPDVSEGLEHKIKNAADSCNKLDDLIFMIKSKRYTLTRIHRVLLYILLGITKDDYSNSKKVTPYIRVLGVSNYGKTLLSELSLEKKLNVITSVKDFLNKNNNRILNNMLIKDIHASNIYTLAYKKNSTANLDFTQKLITL